jgi:hypothetical protein
MDPVARDSLTAALWRASQNKGKHGDNDGADNRPCHSTGCYHKAGGSMDNNLCVHVLAPNLLHVI